MFQCKDVAEEASNYLEGELPLGKRVGLFIHLMYCKCCRTYLQQIKQTIQTISIIRPRERDNTDTSALAKKLHACSKKNN